MARRCGQALSGTLDGALAQADAIRRGEVSSVELVEQTLARIEERDGELNAFVTLDGERALETARGRLPDGPFRGVPLAVKDLTETRGLRTTFSCRAFADYVPTTDTAMVRRMREAGFVIVGKTNTPEFGITAVTESTLNGACRNPWNTSHTPGGSSGGAAAAVAAGMLPLAHGSDGGGSIRIPASCCGLFGLKPSRGRVSPSPYGGGSFDLSQNGALSVSVRDSAAFLDVLAGYETGDAQWAPPPERPFLDEVGADPGKLRIALTVEPPFDTPVDPACAAAARAAADALTALGHHVVERTPPWRRDDLLDTFALLWQVGPALSGVEDLTLLEPISRELAEAAARTPSHLYAGAVAQLQRYARRVVEFWNEVDLVLTPTLALPPVPVGWVFEPEDPWEQFRRAGAFTPFTAVVNLTGQPAMSVPFGSHKGLPLGVHLIGPPAGEALLFRLAGQLEAAHPWADALPIPA